MQINSFLEISAEKHPHKEALLYNNKWLTYLEINSLANKVGNYMIERGIKRGDRVALLFENSHDYVICYYAILKIGGITVALNTETTAEALVYYLSDSGSRMILTQKKFARFTAPAIQKTAGLEEIIVDQDDLSIYEEIGHCEQTRLKDIYENGNDKQPPTRCIDLDIASLVYTSGSTGKPKAVTLTHLNVVSNTRSIVEYLELTAEDRIISVLPFYYIYGKSLLNTHFFVGGSVVIDNRFAYPNVILETMKKNKVTGFSGVPSTFMILLNRSSINEYEFENLRYITQAGGAMAPSIQKKVAKVFEPAKLYIMYGATEASARLSYLDPKYLSKKWGSIGKAIPNVDLFIADDKGDPKPHGTEGEIVARGSNLMQGYWNDLESTNQVLKNGLYYTGDIGYMDDEGFLFVVGRKKDIIKVGGERVSAKEIEEVLLQLKSIREIAVIGVDDDVLGEAIKAYIAVKSGDEFNKNELRRHCKKKLPLFKHPKHVEIISELPKNKSGKVLKNVLRDIHNNSLTEKS